MRSHRLPRSRCPVLSQAGHAARPGRENARLVGAVLFGDVADSLWYLELIRAGTVVDHLRPDLIFGRAFVDEAA